MHSHIPMTVMGMQCCTRATHSRVWPTMSYVHVMLIKASLNWPHTRCGVTCIEESPLSLLHYELQDILCSPSQRDQNLAYKLSCCCHHCCSALAFVVSAFPSFMHCPFKVSCTVSLS